MPTYAGIGSRETPPPVLKQMKELSAALAAAGWLLRTGNADGADKAFLEGSGGKAELWLPWEGYNNPDGLLPAYEPRPEHFLEAQRVHPKWDYLTPASKALHARNVGIIRGGPHGPEVRFVVCWTPDAKVTGGTGLGIRLALARGIPVFNLARRGALKALKARFLEHLNGTHA